MTASRQIVVLLLAAALACLAVNPASAFSVPSSVSRVAFATSAPRRPSSGALLFMSDSSEPDSSSDTGIAPEPVSTPPPAPPAAIEDENDYPLNVPSPILLGMSMILAIASIGSIFELSGGSPANGFAPTAAIAAIGLPSCLFLFYAAIKKGMAETEEDDKAFLNK